MRHRAILIIACLASFVAAGTLAQPTIYVEPHELSVPRLGVPFTIDVRVADFADLRGFSVQVFYNQAALRHTEVRQGDVFTQGGGPGGIFLAAGSIANQGYILADGARIGGGGSTGAGARLFRITFLPVGPGSTDVYFGQILLRDSGNQPMAFETAGGVVAVTSPLPDASATRMYDPGDVDEDYVSMGETALEVRVSEAGPAPRAKLTAARYDEAPPGGSESPFTDPEGALVHLGVTERYWELTSSLADPFDGDLALSFAGLEGPDAPRAYRVAKRELGAGGTTPWDILPFAVIIFDDDGEWVRIEGPPGTFGPGQYALVFDAPVAVEPWPHALDAVLEAYPNPFSGDLTIRYSLAQAAIVRVAAYDLLGRRVGEVEGGFREAGEHVTAWAPGGLAAGVYVLRLEVGAHVVVRRIVRAR